MVRRLFEPGLGVSEGEGGTPAISTRESRVPIAPARLSPATPSVRAVSTRRWPFDVLAVLFFCMVAIVATWPIALHPASTLPDLGDPLDSAWRLSWPIHQLLHDPRHLLDANTYYPFRTTYLFDELIVGVAIVVAPIVALTNNGVLAFNVALLIVVRDERDRGVLPGPASDRQSTRGYRGGCPLCYRAVSLRAYRAYRAQHRLLAAARLALPRSHDPSPSLARCDSLRVMRRISGPFSAVLRFPTGDRGRALSGVDDRAPPAPLLRLAVTDAPRFRGRPRRDCPAADRRALRRREREPGPIRAAWKRTSCTPLRLRPSSLFSPTIHSVVG